MQVNDDFNNKIYNKHDGKSHDGCYLTQKDLQTVQKLAIVDELSNEFWNVAYKEIGKDLIPSRIFSLNNEYHIALEKYLTEHAGHYIKEIGKNGWISLFEDKLLPKIKKQKLEHVDSNASSSKITE
ncbi:hypothetical protein C1646_764671 [Rhizophagus diaphanus]|nr:hypothetical protein C1646_764671 [Rhizophagus diaphanus] [Rhizophagus sp. MUCL 43196]